MFIVIQKWQSWKSGKTTTLSTKTEDISWWHFNVFLFSSFLRKQFPSAELRISCLSNRAIKTPQHGVQTLMSIRDSLFELLPLFSEQVFKMWIKNIYGSTPAVLFPVFFPMFSLRYVSFSKVIASCMDPDSAMVTARIKPSVKIIMAPCWWASHCYFHSEVIPGVPPLLWNCLVIAASQSVFALSLLSWVSQKRMYLSWLPWCCIFVSEYINKSLRGWLKHVLHS